MNPLVDHMSASSVICKAGPALFILFSSCASSGPVQPGDHTDAEQEAAMRCPAQYELADSAELTHIYGLFYRNAGGHLYQRSVAFREGADMWKEYFNGVIAQQVDPLTFRSIRGWYARDAHAVYYYRPVSGGMMLSYMPEADTKTFRVLDGHGRLAMDATYVYEDSQVIPDLPIMGLTVHRDKQGKIIKLTSGTTTHVVQPW